MEDDVVLADEVDEARLRVFPPLFPIIGQQFLGVADVADGRVEPYIQHLALGSFHRHGDAPVEVAAHGAGLQAHVQPALALAIDVGAPLLVVFQNPLAQPGFVLVQGEVPVRRLLHHRLAAADGTLGINQFRGAERRAALLALVAVCSLGVATGTFARDVAVGQESLRLLVIILHGGLLDELALVVEFAEEVRCRLVVYLRCGAPVHVERDAELLERLLDKFVIAVHNVLRRAAFFLGADGDGHPVLVASADEEDFLLLQAQVADIDVGGHIHPRQVADVHRPVGVGQGRCHRGTFEILFHIWLCFIIVIVRLKGYFAEIVQR